VDLEMILSGIKLGPVMLMRPQEDFPRAVLRIRDPVLFLTPGSGMDKKSGSGSGINIPDNFFPRA
jgi:hypothetical protein